MKLIAGLFLWGILSASLLGSITSNPSFVGASCAVDIAREEIARRGGLAPGNPRELVALLSAEQRARLADRLNPNEEPDVEERVRRAFRKGLLDPDIFLVPRASEGAYALFSNGEINENQLTTFQLGWAASREFGPLRVISLFDDENAGHVLPGGGRAPESVDAFLSLARDLPASEQALYEMNLSPALARRPELLAAEAVFGTFLRKLFPPPETTGGIRMVLPSFSLLQLDLYVRHGERAIAMVPQLGAATGASIAQQVGEGRRTFVVPFPGIGSVVEGDGFTFGWTFASVHDFYHAERGSAHTLPAYRRLFSRIYGLIDRQRRGEGIPIERDAGLTPMADAFWTGWAARLTDLEMPSRALFTWGPEPSVLDCLQHDFGERSGADHFVGLLVLRDMARYPDAWRALGVLPEAVASRFGVASTRRFESWRASSPIPSF